MSPARSPPAAAAAVTGEDGADGRERGGGGNGTRHTWDAVENGLSGAAPAVLTVSVGGGWEPLSPPGPAPAG